MKIGIMFNPPAAHGQRNWEASVDVLAQVEAVENALTSLKHRTRRIPFTRDVAGFVLTLQQEKVDAVFNLCETVDEDPALSWHPAALLELLNIPFSGSPSPALMLTADKILTKQLLAAEGILTPRHVEYRNMLNFNPDTLNFPVIVKPRFEDASIGIDQESIFERPDQLMRGIASFEDRFGPVLIEEYIAGREFNLSLFGFPNVVVLPMAEIDFSAFPDTLYSIVGYRAKWDSSSFEYQHTPRRFPEKISKDLRNRLQRTAYTCFALFGLRDYGRVDVRVDVRSNIHVLEVNANPCLSPDAGLAASFEHTGRPYQDLVAALADFVFQRMAGGTLCGSAK
jgi:D-alanine-D-alanine ligase